ncbi:YisL family protein [Sutcliffiella horikoshii]|uniref:YisL family protein n=1 Tax=Sutcliffiella horikoshii TaxID=79883 RepID=UPI001CFE6226|nr:YisL family protein [Sutcliffiella horikoshii]
MFQTLYSIHASVWLLLVISFFITYFINKKKIAHMVLRLFYIVMLGTGISMLHLMGYPFNYTLKGLLAVTLVSLMEILLVRRKKEKKNGGILLLLFLVLSLVLLMGFNVVTF